MCVLGLSTKLIMKLQYLLSRHIVQLAVIVFLTNNCIHLVVSYRTITVPITITNFAQLFLISMETRYNAHTEHVIAIGYMLGIMSALCSCVCV